VSSDLRSPEALEYLKITKHKELITNAITAAIAPDLYQSGLAAIERLKLGEGLNKILPCVQLWVSVYSGVALIVNRVTPSHRDPGAAPSSYDFLVAGGDYQQCTLDCADIGARFSYLPGTAIAISGKILRHSVHDWKGGERICVAHFIKDAVHARLMQPRPSWPMHADYLALTRK
jgi:hypothetical protein